jgi:trigger factor
LKIETTIRDDHQAQLAVELDAETLEKYMHKAAKKISQDAKIPGFRPGKAPYDVVKRMYGEDALKQQALDLMVDEIYPDVIKEAKVEPSAAGTLKNIVSMDPPQLEFLVPLAPEVELNDYRSMRIDYNPPSVTDEEVGNVIEDVRRQSATAEPVERPAQEGDLVYFMIKSTISQPEEGENAEFLTPTPYQMIIGQDENREGAWPYPGFSKELIGLSSAETKDIPYTYPEDIEYTKLRNREVVFHVEIQSVKEMILPELNEEFANNMGEFKDMDDMRKVVHDQLEVNKLAEYDETYVAGMIDQIIEQSTIKFAPQTLDEEVEHLLLHLEEDLKQQHMDLGAYLKARQMEKDAFIENEVKPAASKRLKRSLVLDTIARNEKIGIKNEELQYAVAQRLQEFQNSPNFPKKQSPAQMREFGNAIMYDTAGVLLSQHTLTRLKDIASGNMEKVEQEMAEQAAEEAKENEPAGETDTPAETGTGTGE